VNVELEITAPDRVPLLLLLALLASFGFIRMSTRLMRSPKVPWWPGSITSGDLHIHHLVFGIILLLVCGFLAFAFELGSPWLEIMAVGFGIGAGLTLDEYALWLHLDDVYWAEAGRSSVDATVIAAVFAGLVIAVNPFSGTDGVSTALIVAAILKLIISAIAVIKGKYVLGLVGFFVPIVAETGGIRLARPNSIWARKCYAADREKLRKANEREVTLMARRNRWRDLIGGAPSRVADAMKPGGSAR
jgi:hypothetical protein